MNNKEVINRLRKHYHVYDKNVDIYPNIYSNMSDAITNAKKLEKYQLENGKIIGNVEANPNTEICKLVLELLN